MKKLWGYLLVLVLVLAASVLANDPPTQPTLTYPLGSEMLGERTNATWLPSTDPDGDSVYYVRLVKSNSSPITTGTFSVPSNLQAGTPFTVPAGATSCAFNASGTWTSNTWTGPATGVAGATNPSYTWVMSSSPSFSLVGLRGATPFYIGNSATVQVTSGESLYMLMNDALGASYFGDNSGALSVSYSCN